MTDLLPATNLVLLERESDQAWTAEIRGTGFHNRIARGADPVQAIFNLCRLLRSGGWAWREEYATVVAGIDSPNVIAVRATGPQSWPTWTVASAGGKHPLTNSDYDPVTALEGFALKMQTTGYLMDAEFRHSDGRVFG